jgi:hypothetical protein
MKFERFVPSTLVSQWAAQTSIKRSVPFDGSSQENAAVSLSNFDALGNPAGTYWFRSPSMSSAMEMFYSPNLIDSRGWVRVFSSPYSGTATTNLLGNSIDWQGILVQRSTQDIRHTAYFTTSRLYNSDSSTTTSSSGTRTGFRVFLGGAGAHGIYNTSQLPCNWGDSNNAVGAGWNGSSCGSFPNGLIWGTGQSGTPVYTNLSGTWEHWIYW